MDVRYLRPATLTLVVGQQDPDGEIRVAGSILVSKPERVSDAIQAAFTRVRGEKLPQSVALVVVSQAFAQPPNAEALLAWAEGGTTALMSRSDLGDWGDEDSQILRIPVPKNSGQYWCYAVGFFE